MTWSTGNLWNILAHVLLVSGVQPQSIANWADTLQDKAKEVVTQSQRIRIAIGEDIASSDLEIIYPQPNTLFSEDCMEDVDGRRRNKRGRITEPMPILFATDVGLRRRESMTVEGEFRCHLVTILKANVVLRGAIE